MNRSNYFNYIEEKLNILSYRILNRGRINLLDLNIYSETFFAELFNLLFALDLKNINAILQNAEGIDLIDYKNQVIVQVSSTCTKQKVEKSLDKKIFHKYQGYRFIFIAITGEADELRSSNFKNTYGAVFMPLEDIYDVKSLLNFALNMSINEQRNLYEFLKQELGDTIDIVKVDTNLAFIINILAQEDLSNISCSPEVNLFEIQRKIEFNNLLTAKLLIDEHKIYYSRIDGMYKEFDKQGSNKSRSVFSVLQNQYSNLLGSSKNSHEIFFLIIDNVIELIKNSKNYIEIPYEELEMCVSILVVDSFIRCKIFENPEGYNHVVT